MQSEVLISIWCFPSLL